MNTPCETPAGFLMDATEFFKAAELLLNQSSSLSLPVYFLFSRSIELSLKAFLLSKAMTAKQLSIRPYGHNLVKLFEEANNHRLKEQVSFELTETGALELLSCEYLSTCLGYRVTNRIYQLPRIDLTEKFSRKLIDGLAYLKSA